MTESEQQAAILTEAQDHLSSMQRMFSNGKVTLLVRFPDKPNADLIISNDEFDGLEAMFHRIKRRVAEDKMGLITLTYEQVSQLGYNPIPVGQWCPGMKFDSDDHGALELVERPTDFEAGKFLLKKV